MSSEEKDYTPFLQKSLNLRKIREDRSKDIARDTLFKSSKKKVQTTMIGALSTLEEAFGFLWGFQSDEDITEEQQKLKEIYEEARAKILDRGNTQIRNLEAEFSNYDVSRKRFQINIPVKNNEDLNSFKEGEQNDG